MTKGQCSNRDWKIARMREWEQRGRGGEWRNLFFFLERVSFNQAKALVAVWQLQDGFFIYLYIYLGGGK